MTEKKKKKSEVILEFIRKNPHLTAKQLAIKLNDYGSYISKIAKESGIELPKEPKGRKLGWRKSEDKKVKTRMPIKEEKKEEEEQEQVEEDTTLKAAEEILRRKEERRKEIEANRPKGVYNQSTSPYGLTEEFGISAKTKK